MTKKQLKFLKSNFDKIDFPLRYIKVAQALMNVKNLQKPITHLMQDLKCSRYIINQVMDIFKIYLDQNLK